MAHLDGQRRREAFDEGGQFCKPGRTHAGGQLQPERRHPPPKRLQQALERLRAPSAAGKFSAWLISRGNLAQKRKSSGIWLAQRWTLSSDGQAYSVVLPRPY